MEEHVILVDANDRAIGTMEKMEAHQRGSLHRAFSVFIFNNRNELLLQQRALSKYHSPGLWSNTCCSHPKPGEETLNGAQRRLMEEMGMHTDLNYVFNFTYEASFSNGLIEHEYDHVFFGQSDELPNLNPSEVAAYKYLCLDALAQELEQFPNQYTPWLKICFDAVINFKKSNL